MNYHLPLISLSIGATAALIAVSPARAGQFADVAPDYWAYDYIEELAARQMINGYEDGHFRPMETVTRSQFAAIVQQAFLSSEPIPELALEGVPPDYWAYDALAIARVRGFLPGGLDAPVQPAQVLTRGDALAALVNGLGYEGDAVDLTYYVDVEQIPDPLRPAIAAATQAQIVVSYPEVNWLHANRLATRAEVAAFVYQALVQEGQAEPLAAAPYVANSPDALWSTTPIATVSETAQQISLSRGGTRLATLSPDGDAIRIWQGQSGAAVTEILADSTTRFHTVAVSHDGTQVAAIAQTGSDNSLKLLLWDLETSRQRWQRSLGAAQEQSRWSSRLAFGPDDNVIFSQVSLGSGSEDRHEELQLQLHDAATGERMRSLPPTLAVKYEQFAFSPDGAWLAGYGWSQPETAPEQFPTRDRIIDIWQVETGARNRTLRPVAENFYFVDMVFTAADSLRVLSQQYYDTHLDTWNVSTGERSELTTTVPFIDRQDGLVRLSPDGDHYFVRGDVAGTRLIDIPPETVTYLEGRTTRAMFDATGNYLAIAAQDGVRIFARSTLTTP
ncbi:MAG: S-layer homology domain-containing protein [Cyanobacteria bacterium P01_H01_bin.119]